MSSKLVNQIFAAIALGAALPIHLACQVDKREARIMEDSRKEDVSVSFYGKVLDDHNQPIEGAKVELSIKRFSPIGPYFQVEIPKSLKTDKHGCFSVSNERGRRLIVEPIKIIGYDNKPFYDTASSFNFGRYKKDNAVFCYYQKNTEKGFTDYVPDPNNPMVYRLRKKGPESFLWKGGGGFSFTSGESGTYKGYDYFRESPFPIKESELAHPTVYGQPVVCDLRAQAILDPRTGSWTVVLAPGNPEGGIQSSDQLLYEAPLTGYQPSLTFKVDGKAPKDTQDKADFDIKMPVKFLYLRSRKAPIYSRIEMGERFRVRWRPSSKDSKTLTSELSFSASAVLNPYGDRILEEATDLPGDVRLKLMDEVDEAIRRGGRPAKPDLPKLLEEWKKNRPVGERVRDIFKR